MVQLYVRHPRAKAPRPKQELKGFERVTLEPGEARTVRFALPAASLAWWNEARHAFAVEAGPVDVMLGSSSADIRSTLSLQTN